MSSDNNKPKGVHVYTVPIGVASLCKMAGNAAK